MSGALPPDDPSALPTSDGFEPVTVDAPDEAEVVEADAVDSVKPMPPPVPGAPPLRPRAPSQLPDDDDVTALDRDFIQRVFAQVKDVDFRAPPPPPPQRDLAGPDKKIASLRQKVHELERDLARVGAIWGTLQKKYESVEQIIAAKEAERATVLERQKDLRSEMAKASAQSKSEFDAAKQRIAQLDTMKNHLDGELKSTRAEAEKLAADLNAKLSKAESERTALIAEFRSKMEAAQQAFNQLREQSTRAVADLEGRGRKLDEELSTRKQEVTVAQDALADRQKQIETLTTQLSARTADVEKMQADQQRLAGRLAERDKTLTTIADEMQRARTQHDQMVAELRDGQKTKDELLVSVRNEVQSARAEFAQLAAQHDERKREIEAERTARAASEQRVSELAAELGAREQALAEAKTALEAAREEGRLARADADELGKKLAEKGG